MINYEQITSACLLFYLLIITISIIFISDIIIAIILSSMFSLIIAAAYLAMGAIDVAITEAIVGAGVSTIFYINAIKTINKKTKKNKSTFHVTISIATIILTAILLLMSMSGIHKYGDINAPTNNHIYRYYIDVVKNKFHFGDIVTAILASIRGYDTLGETTVVMLAAISVLLIMDNNHEKYEK